MAHRRGAAARAAGGYNQNVQVFQTPDHVVLLNEMIHKVRVIPLDGRAHLPAGLRQWMASPARRPPR